VAFTRRLTQFLRLKWRERADLLEATWRLALANRQLAWGAPVDVARLITQVGEHKHPATPGDDELVARVVWAIPRAAAVVPWRADCLRQAEAARVWLARNGLRGDLKLGARRDAHGRLETHAWLLWRGEVVTGGDTALFVPFAKAEERRSTPLAR
jgi:hypothetical protein